MELLKQYKTTKSKLLKEWDEKEFEHIENKIVNTLKTNFNSNIIISISFINIHIIIHS